MLINSNTHAAMSSYTDWFVQKVLDIKYVEILVLLKVLYSFCQKQLLYDLGLDAMVPPLWLAYRYRNRTRGMWLPVEMSSWSFPVTTFQGLELHIHTSQRKDVVCACRWPQNSLALVCLTDNILKSTNGIMLKCWRITLSSDSK